jgi:hypothetical protein
MCGAPKEQVVTQKTELDPNLRRLLYGGVFQGPAAAQPAPGAAADPVSGNGGSDNNDAMSFPTATGGDSSGYLGLGDMFDRGGPGGPGERFEGGGRLSDIANAVTGRGPEASGSNFAMGGPVMPQMGIASLNQGQMPMMNGQLPNLSDPMVAATLAAAALRPQMQYNMPMGFAVGGYVEGPGTGTSDSIDAVIMQNGQPVQEALLSDGEFVMTERAVRGAGNGDREAGAAKMYEMMRQFERGGRV